MFPIINVFGREIGSYAVCSFIGLFVSVFVAVCLTKRLKLLFEDVILMVLAVSLGMLLGGHFLYGITNISKIVSCIEHVSNFSEVLGLFFDSFGGMVFYGGFIGCIIALNIYIKHAKIKQKSAVNDIFAICVPLFHVFGRVGCFLGGCCYGIESKFGFIANNRLVIEMSGVRRFPVSLVEGAFNLLIFFFLLYLFKQGRKNGKLLFVYMLIYPIVRFFLEFLRGDEIRGIFFHLSTSQWISICLFIVGIIGYNKIKCTVAEEI